jgi:hypothetical protein
MEDKRYNEIKELLSAYTVSRLYEASVVLRNCFKNVIDFDEFLEFAVLQADVFRIHRKKKLQDRIDNEGYEPLAWAGNRRCPDCGKTLSLLGRLPPLGPRNLKGYKTHWVCQFCYWEEYSLNTKYEELEKYKPVEIE